MKYGVRNAVCAEVKEVKLGDIMAQAKFTVGGPLDLTSIISRESMEELNLKPGDKVRLMIKAINVVPVKD